MGVYETYKSKIYLDTKSPTLQVVLLLRIDEGSLWRVFGDISHAVRSRNPAPIPDKSVLSTLAIQCLKHYVYQLQNPNLQPPR